jgi:hypothetical protein
MSVVMVESTFGAHRTLWQPIFDPKATKTPNDVRRVGRVSPFGVANQTCRSASRWSIVDVETPNFSPQGALR